jgi:hypothetical protein
MEWVADLNVLDSSLRFGWDDGQGEGAGHRICVTIFEGRCDEQNAASERTGLQPFLAQPRLTGRQVALTSDAPSSCGR